MSIGNSDRTRMNQHVCRCCLVENPLLTYNIFDPHSNLWSELVECSPSVKIEPNDGLPEVICDLCWLRVRETVEFRRICIESDRELRKRYDEMNQAIEEAVGLLQQLTNQESPAMTSNDVMAVGLKQDSDIQRPTNGTQDLLDFDTLEMPLLDELFVGDYCFGNVTEAQSYIEMENSSVKDLFSTTLDFYSNCPIPPDSSTTNNIASKEQNTEATIDGIPKRTECQSKPAKALHPCSECEKRFTRNFQLKLHLISVHNKGDGLRYKCPECQKTFASHHSLSYHHKSMHSLERPVVCDHCQRRFVLRSQLASHMRIHTGESKPRIHECMECGKRWPTKSDLRTHMRTHDHQTLRPFKCNSCEKRFFTRGHLNSHILVHTGEKPHSCAFCGKSYQSVGNLNNHLVRRHTEQLPQSR